MKGFVAAASVLLCLAAAPAWATSNGSLTAETAAALTPNAYVWQDKGDSAASGDDVRLVISIADQRAYVYRNSSLIAVSTVSTGKQGKDTPAGIYPILQKEKEHRSNLYNAAPMPFMQRLTWDGIAIHAGRNPGFPASHGCIRVPTAFAAKLFAITQVGTTVEVTDDPVDPELSAPGDELLPADEIADVQTAKANQAQYASIDQR